MDEFFEKHFVKKFLILFIGGIIGAIIGGQKYTWIPYTSHGNWSFEIDFYFFIGIAIGILIAMLLNFILFRAIPNLYSYMIKSK